MAANGKPTSSFVRPLIMAASVIGWVSVIVVSAGSRPDDRTWIGLPDLDDLMGIVFVAVVAWAIYWTIRVLRFRPGGAKKTRPANLITLWLGLALAIAILLVNPEILERFQLDESEQQINLESPDLTVDEPPPPTDFEITANQVYVVLLALGVWMGVTVVSRRRIGSSDRTDEDDENADGPDLAAAIDAMVDDLELDTDPRSAVLAAYHRLERALAEQDRPRRMTETPSEHLDRVLATLPINRDPFLDLAHRYELARYSDHRVTESDRDQAAADLAEARNDLLDLAPR